MRRNVANDHPTCGTHMIMTAACETGVGQRHNQVATLRTLKRFHRRRDLNVATLRVWTAYHEVQNYSERRGFSNRDIRLYNSRITLRSCRNSTLHEPYNERVNRKTGLLLEHTMKTKCGSFKTPATLISRQEKFFQEISGTNRLRWFFQQLAFKAGLVS